MHDMRRKIHYDFPCFVASFISLFILVAGLRFPFPRNSRARVKFFTSRGNSAVFRGIHVPVYIRYMPVYIRQNTQIYGKYRGFGVLLGLLGGVVPLCSLCPLRVAFCVVRASF